LSQKKNHISKKKKHRKLKQPKSYTPNLEGTLQNQSVKILTKYVCNNYSLLPKFSTFILKCNHLKIN